MNKNLNLLVGFIVVLVLIAATTYLISSSRPLKPFSQEEPTASLSAASQTSKISYQCQKGKTAFEALQKSTKSVEYTDSALGKMVTAINGVSQGDGKYWLYSIDGQEATIGASAYTCQDNEKIEWDLK